MNLKSILKLELALKETIKIISAVSAKGNPILSIREAIFFNTKGKLVLLESAETSNLNKALTYSLWYSKKIKLIILCKNNARLSINASLIRAIISGKEFERYYLMYTNIYKNRDLSTAWIMNIDEINDISEIEKDVILTEEEQYPMIKHLDKLLEW